MKNEITVENIIHFFNNELLNIIYDTSNFFTTSYNYKTFISVSESLLDFFFYEYKIRKISCPDNKSILRSIIYINKEEKEKYIKNIKKIEFKKLYPNIICKLINEGKIDTNIDEFFILYDFIIKNHESIRPYLNDEPIKLFNILINFLYVVSGNSYNYVYFNNAHLILDYIKVTFSQLFSIGNVLYLDTDVIYYNGNEDEIIEKIDKLFLPYEIKDVYLSYFISKKNYIVIEDKVKSYGRRILKQNNVHDNFKQYERKMKIDNLVI